MTQFEVSLKNLRDNLETEKEAYKQEKWREIQSTTLAEYRKSQEDICNEGIAILQRKKEEACLRKEEELKATLNVEAENMFGTAADYLEKAQFAFNKNGQGGSV